MCICCNPNMYLVAAAGRDVCIGLSALEEACISHLVRIPPDPLHFTCTYIVSGQFIHREQLTTPWTAAVEHKQISHTASTT